MQSPREDMREILEKAVIIESAKTDSGFKYTYASKEAYKIVFIKNDLFHCIRGLTDPHNSCEQPYGIYRDTTGDLIRRYDLQLSRQPLQKSKVVIQCCSFSCP